ncbi:MAG: LysE family transporter [Veillonellales bacterium]
MGFFFLLKGVVLGFSIAAPVGPIGILCIRRTLAYGMLNGFISGMGAATADGIYGGIAVFGVTVVSVFLLDYQVYLRLIGGFFLLYLGYTTFTSYPAETAVQAGGQKLFQAYGSTVLLTLANPMTILVFAAVFAGMGVGTIDEDYGLAAFMVVGVFIGSMLWWLILSGGVNLLRSKFDTGKLLWVNRLSGTVIAGFGIFSLIAVVR